MEIVPCEKEHIPAAVKMLIEAYFNPDDAEAYVTEKASFGECYVALDGGVVGVFCFISDYSYGASYLCDIVVEKDYRRKGIAMDMLEKYIELCKTHTPKKQKWALSSCDVENVPAIEMHIRAGFENIGSIEELHFGKNEIFFGYDVSK